MSLDVASLTTALAVNMGIAKTSGLVKVDGDVARITLLGNMRDVNSITDFEKYNTSSYFGK